MFEPFILEFKGLKKYFTDGLYREIHSNVDVKETNRTLANGTYSYHFYSIFGWNTLHATQSELILLNIISSNYCLMSESINIHESAGQFMVLDMISRRIEDADKIKRIIKISNAEPAESFKAVSYFSYHFLPNKRRVFMLKGVSVDSSAFYLSLGSQRGDFSI